MDEIVRKPQAPIAVIDVRIGQVACERGIVIAKRRRQQQRPRTLDRQIKVRQMAGIAMEETLGTAMTRQRVAIMIEHGEGVAVL